MNYSLLPKIVPVKFGYSGIKIFAELFEKKTSIRNLYDFSEIITKLGGQINFISLSDWETNKFPFMYVESTEKFAVFICATFPDDVKRLLFAQVLAYYFLHSQEGKSPCVIPEVAKDEYNTEALLFASILLIPDNLFLKLIKHKNITNEIIAKLFRVPHELILFKKSFLGELIEG